MTEPIGPPSHALGRPPGSMFKTVAHVMTTGGVTATLAAAPCCVILAAGGQSGSLSRPPGRFQIEQWNAAVYLVNVRVTKTSQNVHSALPAQVDPCRGRRSARSTPASIRQHTAHDAVCCRPLRPLGVPRASKLQGDSVGGAARRRRQSITTIGLRGRIDVLSARNAFPQ